MFRALLCAAVCLAGCLGARAASLTLEVNPTSGQAWIANNSAQTIIFDGYTIQALMGALDPFGWVSFEDYSLADPPGALALLGNISWQELASSSALLAEANLPEETVAMPGFRAPLGTPIATFIPGKLRFTYLDFSLLPDPIREVSGLVEVVPEPGSLMLAGIALALCVVVGGRRDRVRVVC